MNEKPKELHKQTSGNKTKKRKRNTGSILDAQDVYGELVGLRSIGEGCSWNKLPSSSY